MSNDTARITITASVPYRGRTLTITCEGLDADRFCDMLDRRFGEPPAAPSQASAPSCPDHPDRTLKAMKYADKHGHTMMCTARDAAGSFCDYRA